MNNILLKISIKEIFIILGILLIISWIIWTNVNITSSYFQIENEKIPPEFDGFKIVHVSDLHNHPWKETLINKIKTEEPDLIAITGDLVDSSRTDFDIAVDFIKEAGKIAPIYYVTGNHEASLKDYSVLKERLEKNAVNMMDNTSLFIERGANKIKILGVQDPDFVEPEGRKIIQGEIVYNKINELLNKNYFNIILTHRPEHFKQYVSLEADLVLAGHAHGGQVRIPFIGGLIAPHQGIFPKYTEGLYTDENTSMIVSRGLGNSIIPIRINNSPELVIIKLKVK